MVFDSGTMKLSARLSPDDAPTLDDQQKFNANIPKSPSFHSGLDLVAGNKYVNISRFNFANDMNGNNKQSNATTAEQQQSSQQTIFSFSKVNSLEISKFSSIIKMYPLSVFLAVQSTQ
jgi:hypothetical protein